MKKMLGIALLLALSTGGVAFAHSHGEFEPASPPNAKSVTHHNAKAIGHAGHKAGKEPSHAMPSRSEPGAKGHTHVPSKSKS